MRPDTKMQVSKFTLSALTLVASIFILGVVVLVICAGLQINPFREATSEFLLSAFIGLIGVAAVLVLLNVATSMSLIADAKIAELKLEPRPGLFRKWLAGFFTLAVILVVFIFLGTWLSKKRYMAIVRSQAEDVMHENQALLQETATRLAAGKINDYMRVSEIRKFLEEQRADLPALTVIYSVPFGEKQAFYQIRNSYFDYDTNKNYMPIYFPCTKNRDCDYLNRFFSGQTVNTLESYTFREDEFYIYIPFVGKDARFVLLFQKINSFGKIGS